MKKTPHKLSTSISSAPIIVECIGGLGNQLFQFSMGLLLNKLSGRPLYLDVTHILQDKKRNPDIIFLINDPQLHYIHHRRTLFHLLGTRILGSLSLFEKIIHILFPYQKVQSCSRYTLLSQDELLSDPFLTQSGAQSDTQSDTRSDTQSSVLDLSEAEQFSQLQKIVTENQDLPLFVRGYWQERLYFDQVQDLFAKMFSLSKEQKTRLQQLAKALQSKHDIDWNHATSLHVRRTDFLSTQLPTCSLQYYREAVQHVLRNDKKAQILVFTDDPAWCLHSLDIQVPFVLVSQKDKTQHSVFAEALTDIDELLLMNLCKHSILSNSTFSWWGKILPQKLDVDKENGQKENSVTVAPFPWYPKKENKDGLLLLDLRWIILDRNDGTQHHL